MVGYQNEYIVLPNSTGQMCKKPFNYILMLSSDVNISNVEQTDYPMANRIITFSLSKAV